MKVIFSDAEGNCISVEQIEEASSPDDKIRSKSPNIVVQTATANTAVNDYDAQSNGDFDELAVTAVRADAGEAFIFEYRDGVGNDHSLPTRMAGFGKARDAAIRSAIAIVKAQAPIFAPLRGWLVRVRGEKGELVCTVTLADPSDPRLDGN